MTWNDLIVNKITSNHSNMVIVLDPDEILMDEKILSELIKRDYNVFSLTDVDYVRFEIETRKIENKDNKLILVSKEDSIKNIPYDFYKNSSIVHLKLGEIFEGLSYKVIREIDASLFDDLYKVYQNVYVDTLGETETIKFVLENVYRLNLNSIKDEDSLFFSLFRLYYAKKQIGPFLKSYIIDYLAKDSKFSNLSLSQIITDSDIFWGYVQKEWEIYINDKGNNTDYANINFENKEIVVFLDDLFYEGYLSPISFDKSILLSEKLRSGIIVDSKKQLENKINILLDRINEIYFLDNITYKHWFEIAYYWADVVNINDQNKNNLDDKIVNRIYEQQDKNENKFTKWLLEYYGSLSNLSYLKGPVIVHQIPRYINYKRNKKEKIALIIIDGLALNQWFVIREYLKANCPSLVLEEKNSFAWIPTITSVSRQAIFSGETPMYFRSSINTTNKEEKHWERFWSNEGFKSFSVKYKRGLGKGSLEEIKDIVNNKKVNTVGFVIDIVDKMMHGQQLGNLGMLKSIDIWLEKGYLKDLFEILFKNGYTIYLTSDHGNIHAYGKGSPKQGSLVDTKGERVRIYSNDTFAKDIKEQYDSIIWPGYGLPNDMNIVIAEGNSAYITDGKDIVSHGGISIEEVIVPFVKIWKDENE